MGEIATRLKLARKDQGLGTRDFAAEVRKRTGFRVSHNMVSAYEGRTRAPAAYVAAVAAAFGEPVDWLLGLSDERRPPDPTAAERAFRMIARIADEARRPAADDESPTEQELRFLRAAKPEPDQEQTGG